ncbi:lipopolysaccharide biosynthesis protein [Thermophilibacter sp.]
MVFVIPREFGLQMCAKSEQGSLSIKRNMFWNTIGSIFYQGCLWLMTVLVVRLSTDYQSSGMLAFAMSVGNIYTAIGTYTMRTYQVADVTERYSTPNYVALRIVTVCGGLFLCGVYAALISPTTATFLVIVTFLLFKANEAFVNVLYGCDQVAMRLDYVGISQILRGVVIVAAFSAGMILTDSLVLSLLLVFIGNLLLDMAYDLPRTRRLVGSLRPHISRRQCLSLLKECFPTVAANVLNGLVVSVSRQIFGNVYGEDALGIYASVATPCVVIQVLAQNLYTPLLGPIAEKYRHGNCGAAKAAAKKLLLLVTGVALGVSAVLAIMAEPLLTLIYGSSISPYVNVLPLALVVMTGVATTTLIGDLLIVLNHLKTSLAVNGLAFAISLALVIPCTQAWYMNGLNIALIAAYAIADCFGIAQVFRRVSQPWAPNDGSLSDDQ